MQDNSEREKYASNDIYSKRTTSRSKRTTGKTPVSLYPATIPDSAINKSEANKLEPELLNESPQTSKSRSLKFWPKKRESANPLKWSARTRKIGASERLGHQWMFHLLNYGPRYALILLWAAANIALFVISFIKFDTTSSLDTFRSIASSGLPFARASAACINFNTALILVPVCRNIITLLRRTPLAYVIPLDDNLNAHKVLGWTIVFFSLIHAAAHFANIYRFSDALSSTGLDRSALSMLWSTGTGATGIFLTLIICLMFTSSLFQRVQRLNFEVFWYTHQMYPIYYILLLLHGNFCFVKADSPPYCQQKAQSWMYVLPSVVLFVVERFLREYRARQETYIVKVIAHPSKVIEIQLVKPTMERWVKPGQYVFICCPEISIFQWHPFTLTSCPEDKYISIHMRVVGDWTESLAALLNIDFDSLDFKKSSESLPPDSPKRKSSMQSKTSGKLHPSVETLRNRLSTASKKRSRIVTICENNRLYDNGSAADLAEISRNVDAVDGDKEDELVLLNDLQLPTIYIDGPYGSASETVFNYKVAVLIGAGIGVTPFASVLKSIWYRAAQKRDNMKLQRVHFIWICRDTTQFEWFHDLLRTIEAEDMDDFLEISVYLTGVMNPEQIKGIIASDKEGHQDALTGLRTPTCYGRPNFKQLFQKFAELYSGIDIGVFFTGPHELGNSIQSLCFDYSIIDNQDHTHFIFHREHF